MNDFYISYVPSDQELAEWIAWQLEASGWRVFFSAWDLRIGDDFLLTLSKAMNEARFVIAVISPNYFKGEGVKLEWKTALEISQLTEHKNRLIPVLVREIDADTFLLPSIPYINLVGISDRSEAKQRLITGIQNFIGFDKQPERETDSPVKNEPPEAMQSQGDINVEVHRVVNPTLYPPAFPPSWASEWGEDEFGLYVDWNYKAIVQRFRWIVPGTFLMGSPESEPERHEDEILHPVTLTQGFWLADSACTQALWLAVMGSNPSHFQGLHDNPVEQVSWDDVQRFIQALNERSPQLVARLPTEAEWEYACRAGTTTPFAFGDTLTSEQVNYHGNYPYAGAAKGLLRGKTVPVKSLPPNPWGVYEMHGNVLEWCADWLGGYPKMAVVDPSGPPTGQFRVLRGGSWLSLARGARSAYRYRIGPGYRFDFIGFRLALGRVPGSGR